VALEILVGRDECEERVDKRIVGNLAAVFVVELPATAAADVGDRA